MRDDTATAGRNLARPAVVAVKNVTKEFPGVRALTNVEFALFEGEVHGLVGQNGAGKSTLIRMITGADAPDSGAVEVYGQVLSRMSPRAHLRAGIRAIYQKPALLPNMAAEANVFIGERKRWQLLVSRRSMRRRFFELAKVLDVHIDPTANAGTLPLAQQRQLELMRAINANHRIVIMDEPTAALGPHDREVLYSIIEGFRERGVSIVYVSHDLGEVLALCDRVSVMRDGFLIATRAASQWSVKELVAAMLGRAISKTPSRLPAVHEDEVLRVDKLKLPGALEEVSLTLRRGEILGIGGLVGSGRSELLRSLAGAEPHATGSLVVDGRERHWPKTIRQGLALGIGLAPEDRKQQGLILSLSAAANVVLTDIGQVSIGPVVIGRKRFEKAREVASSLGFDARRLPDRAGTLSGGNQQKLVIAKWLHRQLRVLLLDEPTRGIDVGAKADLMAVMARLAADGLSIVIVSSDMEEIAEISDRILVLAKGRSVTMLEQGSLTVDAILSHAFEALEVE